MSRPPVLTRISLVRRLALTAVGVGVLLAYASAAALVVLAFAAILTADVSLVAVAALVAAGTLIAGYLSYRYGTPRVLAELNAVPLSARDAPNAYRRLQRLADRMDVETPRLYVARLPAPNALSVGGPGGGSVLVDESLFRFLDPDEFEAVLAHELAHLERRDTLVEALAYTAVRTLVAGVAALLVPVALLARGVSRLLAYASGHPSRRGPALQERVGAVVVLALVVLLVLVRTRSRHREFAADERAVDVTGDPVTLASALRKIERASDPTAGLLGRFTRREDETHWLSTHPAMDERVRRLRERAEADGVHRIEVQ
ncbi:MAG: M48 family metallopeptidase [Halobacterium sp.]